MHGHMKILIRGGEWSFKNSGSGKFFSQISISLFCLTVSIFIRSCLGVSIFRKAKGFEVPSHLGIRFHK